MKRFIAKIFDFSLTHPTANALMWLFIFLAIIVIGGIFRDTIIPKILAFLIVAFFVVIIIIAVSADYKELEKLRKEKQERKKHIGKAE